MRAYWKQNVHSQMYVQVGIFRKSTMHRSKEGNSPEVMHVMVESTRYRPSSTTETLKQAPIHW